MRSKICLIPLMIPLLLSSLSPLVSTFNEGLSGDGTVGGELGGGEFGPSGLSDDWRSFTIDENRILSAVGSEGERFIPTGRATLAISRLGIHGVNGTLLGQELPNYALQPRHDLSLLIIDGDVELSVARSSLAMIEGLVVREYISPSGLVIQGTPMALMQAEILPEVRASLEVPLAMLASEKILSGWVEDSSGASLQGMEVRIEGWRDDVQSTVPDSWLLVDDFGRELRGDVGGVADTWLDDARQYDDGRWEGRLSGENLAEVLGEPALGWLRPTPDIGFNNERSRDHMEIDTFQSNNPYFTSPLDGSGEIVAVADTGIDHDHGDFGSRIDARVDMVGDGSTADTDSGHGTHVACTIVGDGTRGGYKGVASGANLYFQAMEQDSTGNMYSASINYLVNTAYDNGARTHSNSWGSKDASVNGQYTSDSEDVDDRANYYDRYYDGRQGMSIIFAAGNDGPDPGSIGPPSTAKNSLTVGMHQSRYSGSPDTVMSGSGRGPTDDGRIKPDILAPGGYVRSCRAQEAQDTSGSSWTNQWYMEYTGTSMATPNAAGAAVLVREYLTEIALRPSPQGALVKALLVLGAEDIGSRNIPNNNEGWGRINLKNSLAPSGDRGIWVDDRSVMSNSGSVKTYTFEVEQGSFSFKAVLTWSDERGSRLSSSQLVNDLDLEVEDPDGTVYLGNVFASGRSQVGGTRDTVNNLEVVLIDVAPVGTWTVRVKDASHGGWRSQPFAIAISGNGVNDLRPDPTPVAASITTATPIPQVGESVLLSVQIENLGNVAVEDVLVHFKVDDNLVDSSTINLNPAEISTVFWYWTPADAGNVTVAIEVDPLGDIDEIRENNNIATKIVGVTTPGVRLSCSSPTITLLDSEQTVTSWQVNITNTALIQTNASISVNGVMRQFDGSSYSWYVGLSETGFILNGGQTASTNVTVIHPSPPDPGVYAISLTGIDNDNSISFPYEIFLEVPNLAKARVSFPTVVVVSPVLQTNFSLELFNDGNADIGYNLFLDSPTGWQAGFTDLGAQPGAPSASSGAITRDGSIQVGISVSPPVSMVRAGSNLSLDLHIVSQTENAETWTEVVNLRVGVYEDLEISLESTIGMLRPDSSVNLQFSVFNEGNSDLTLTPSIQLPGGWSVTSGMNTFSVDYGDGHNWLVGIAGNGQAVGGPMTLVLSSPSGEISWTINLSVFSIADPQITFSSITYPDSSTFSQITGGGAHVPGSLYNLTWAIENQGDGAWSPYASLALPIGYNGSCEAAPKIDSGDTETITCSVAIPADEMPDLQPQIVLTMHGGGLEISDTVSLLIAEVAAVTWSDELLPELETGIQHLVKLRIENTGNSMLSHVIVVDAPDGWEVIIDSGSTISLQAGQSASVRLFVTASTPGSEQCTVRLTNAEGVADSDYTFNLTATGEVQNVVGSGMGSVIMWSSLIIIIIGGSLAIVLLMRKEKGGKKSHPDGRVNSTRGYGTSVHQPAQGGSYWPAQPQQSLFQVVSPALSASTTVPQVAPSTESFTPAPESGQHPSQTAPQVDTASTNPTRSISTSVELSSGTSPGADTSTTTTSSGTSPSTSPGGEPSDGDDAVATSEPDEVVRSSAEAPGYHEEEPVDVESIGEEPAEEEKAEGTQLEWPDPGDSDDPWA